MRKPAVKRANLDGTGAETLVTGLDDPVDIAAGRVSDHPLSGTPLDFPILGIVWTDEDEDKMQSIAFDAGVPSSRRRRRGRLLRGAGEPRAGRTPAGVEGRHLGRRFHRARVHYPFTPSSRRVVPKFTPR